MESRQYLATGGQMCRQSTGPGRAGAPRNMNQSTVMEPFRTRAGGGHDINVSKLYIDIGKQPISSIHITSSVLLL